MYISSYEENYEEVFYTKKIHCLNFLFIFKRFIEDLIMYATRQILKTFLLLKLKSEIILNIKNH